MQREAGTHSCHGCPWGPERLLPLCECHRPGLRAEWQLRDTIFYTHTTDTEESTSASFHAV